MRQQSVSAENLGVQEMAALVRDELLPWVLGDKDLGDDALELGAGPGLVTDLLVEQGTPLAARAPELAADPNWELFISALESVPADSNTFVTAYPNWTSELANRYEQVWSGDLMPEAMLEEAQNAIDEEIAANQ